MRLWIVGLLILHAAIAAAGDPPPATLWQSVPEQTLVDLSVAELHLKDGSSVWIGATVEGPARDEPSPAAREFAWVWQGYLSRIAVLAREASGRWGPVEFLTPPEELYHPRVIVSTEGPSAAAFVVRQAGGAFFQLDVVALSSGRLEKLDTDQAEGYEQDVAAGLWVAHERPNVMDLPRLLRWDGRRLRDVSAERPEWYAAHLPPDDDFSSNLDTRIDQAFWLHMAGQTQRACEALRAVSAQLKTPEDDAWRRPMVSEEQARLSCKE